MKLFIKKLFKYKYLFILIFICIFAYSIRGFYAENTTNIIYFDISKGSITIGSSYSGYDADGNKVSGTYKSGDVFYITQADHDTKTANNITFSQNTTDLYEVVLDNVYMGASSYSTNTNYSQTGMIFIDAISNSKNIVLKLKNENIIHAIRYYTGQSNSYNENAHLEITNYDDENPGYLYIPEKAVTQEEIDAIINSKIIYNYWDAGIGGSDTNDSTTGLTISGGNIQVLTTSGEYANAIGGGGNGYADINITGGNIKAICNGRGSAIGGGSGGNSASGKGVVNITGGEIYAANYGFGIAIGGGSAPTSAVGGEGIVNISGGKVTAISSSQNAIGGGSSSSGSGGVATINISGGTIVSSNIGGGYSTSSASYNSADIVITGGSINANFTSYTTDNYRCVSLTKVTLYDDGKVKSNQLITSLSGTDYADKTYGMNDVYTDENGILYLWFRDDSKENVIYFDISKGQINLGSSYSGYDKNGNEITGTFKPGDVFYITQEDHSTSTTNNITFSQSSSFLYEVILDNVYMEASSYATGAPQGSYNTNETGMIIINAKSNSKNIVLKLKNENIIRSIRYYTGNSNGSLGSYNKKASLEITNYDNTDPGYLYIPEKAVTQDDIDALVNSSTNYNHYNAGIGGNDDNSTVTGLTISGGNIQVLTTYADNTTAIGAGGNGYAQVNITGGNVKAISYGTGAAIGGGSGWTNLGGDAEINISGGEVYAANYGEGVAIGAGSTSTQNGGTGNINITGGKVTAYSNSKNAIGGGVSTTKDGGQATVNISGGTVVSSNIGGGYSPVSGYKTSDITITGGSINATVSNVPTNGTENVYLTRPTLYDKDVAKSNQLITSLSGSGIDEDYGLNDVYTDDNGTLYLWIPENAVITGASDEESDFSGSVSSTSVGVLQINSSKLFYSLRISYNKDVSVYSDSKLTSEVNGLLMIQSKSDTSFWIKANTDTDGKYYDVNVYMSDGSEMKELEPISSDTSNGLYKYTVNISTDNYIWIESKANGGTKKLSLDLSIGNAIVDGNDVMVNGYTLKDYDGDYYLTSAGLGVTSDFTLKSGTATVTTNKLIISAEEFGINVKKGTLNLYTSASNDSITSRNTSPVYVEKNAKFNLYDTTNGSLDLITSNTNSSAIGGSGSILISKNDGFITLTQGTDATDITAENYTFVAKKKLSSSALPYSITLVDREFIGYSSLYADGSTYKLYNSTATHTTSDVGEEFKAIGVKYVKSDSETYTPSISSNDAVFTVSNIESDKNLSIYVQNGDSLLESDTDYTWSQSDTTGTLTVNGSAVTDHLLISSTETDKPKVVLNVDDESFEYDGKEHNLTFNVVYPTSDVSIEYCTDSNCFNDDNSKNESATWSSDNPKYTSVGEYTINWIASADNCESVIGTNKLKITKTTNYFTSAGVMIESVYKGNMLNPQATSKYGTPYYEYSSSYNGPYTTIAPTDAGLYYVRAVVDGTSEYDKIISDSVAFYIESPSIYTMGIYSWEKINTLGADNDTTVTVSKDKEVSALVNFNYTPDKENGNYLKFQFSNELPVGTTLTLIDFSDSENKYIYYYTVKTATTTVASNEFMKIGTSEVSTFEKGTDEEVTNVLYQINIKYSEMPSFTTTFEITKQVGGEDKTQFTPITINPLTTSANGSISDISSTINDDNDIILTTNISNLSSIDDFTNVLELSLYDSDGTTPVMYSANAKVLINGKSANINGNIATISDIENGNVTISIAGLDKGTYKIKVGLSNIRNNLNNINYPMLGIIDSSFKETTFTVDNGETYAIEVTTDKNEDRVVNPVDKPETIKLNLKYKAINTSKTPNISVVVKKKSSSDDVIINDWTYILSNDIIDTSESENKIESTTMTITVPKGTSYGYYEVFITLGNKTISLNVVVYDGEISDVELNPDAFSS